MKKAIEILKKVYAIWEYSITKEEIIEIIGKAFVLLASTASFLQPIKKSNENMLRKRKRFIK
jgi:hypothetical protein